MDMKSGKKLLSLIYKIFVEGSRNPSQVPYTPQKVAASPKKAAVSAYPYAAPETVGVSSERLLNLLLQLENGEATNVNTILLCVDGKICLDASAKPYRSDMWHITYSMAKSVTALGIGLLVDDGLLSLDRRLLDLFPEYGGLFAGKIKSATVRDLLTMSISTSFNEAGVLISENWLSSYMETPLREDVGESFSYNSMSTYVLSAIAQKLTGKTLAELLYERIFHPMNIESFLWESSPQGVTKGGFGLYIAPLDMLKLGMLVLDNGVYEGEQLISAEWLSEMTAVHNRPQKSFGNYDYGYQVWVDKERDIVLFNGMLGQDILILPKKRTVAVLTAGNSEIFQHSEMLSAVENCLCDDSFRSEFPLPKNRRAHKALLQKSASFGESRAFAVPLKRKGFFSRILCRLRAKSAFPLPAEAKALVGKRCEFNESNAGLLPLFTCILQNNFSAGIHSLSFVKKGGTLAVDIEEGVFHHVLPIGFYEPIVTEIDEHGEKFLVSVRGEFAKDENGLPLLKLSLGYPELAGERRLTLFYGDENTVTLKIEELPGYAIAEPFVEKIASSVKGIAALLLSYFPIELLKAKVKNGFSPTLQGYWRASENTL